MKTLNQIITEKFPHLKGYEDWAEIDSYVPSQKRHIKIEELKELMISAMEEVLREAAENVESFISDYSHNGIQYCKTEINKKSITDTLNKYL